jgi:hypothetical protein
MTWPLVLRLNSHFAGEDVDVWLNPWATWWTEKAFSEWRSLYYTNWMFYPHGVSLAFHSFFHMTTALALLLRPWLGNLGAHNATVLLAHALSGYAMFCLVRYLSRSLLGAFFAGLVFAFFPYRMAESIHPHLVSTQWMPLYFLFLLRLVEEGRKRHIIPAALFFVLNALSGWHLMTFAIFLSVAYLCYLIVVKRWRWSKATALNLVLLTGLVCVALAPFLCPIVWEQLTTLRSYAGAPLERGRGNDLVAFVLPAKEHPVWGKLLEPMYERVRPRHPAYLGITVIGLTVVAGLAAWGHARFWILVALLSALLSIGPHIQIGGHSLDILAPWSVPIVWLLRHSLRFNLLLGFTLAVTSGLGLSAVQSRLAANRSRWRWSLAGAAMVLLVFEYLYFPFPTTAAVVPDCYSNLAALPGEGAILELPMGRHRSKLYMYYQTVHNRPLVEGHVSRAPQEAYAFIEATPALRSLRACGREALPPANLSLILNALGERGIDYVILHKRLVRQLSLDLWLDTRTVVPDCEDEHIAVYSTQTESLRPSGMAQLLEACVAVRSLLIGSISTLQGEVLEIPLEWIIGNPPQEEYILELALADEAGEIKRRRQYEVVPGASLTTWHLGKRHATSYSFYVDPVIPPGTYYLQARLVPVKRDREELLSADLLSIQVLARSGSFSLPTMHKRVVNATYGSDLRLLRYELEVGGNAVHIVLHWQSLRRMEVDYKFFVHLYDIESEALVAQVDTMPQDWTYPTTWWEAGKAVSDEVMLSLEDLPPGMYRLGVGVYNPHTGERLAITNQPAHFVADAGSLLLPDEIVR